MSIAPPGSVLRAFRDRTPLRRLSQLHLPSTLEGVLDQNPSACANVVPPAGVGVPNTEFLQRVCDGLVDALRKVDENELLAAADRSSEVLDDVSAKVLQRVGVNLQGVDRGERASETPGSERERISHARSALRFGFARDVTDCWLVESQSAEAALLRAHALVAQGDRRGALAEFQLAQQRGDASARLWGKLGELNCRLRVDRESVSDLQIRQLIAAAQREGSDSGFLVAAWAMNLRALYLRETDFETAVTLIDQLLTMPWSDELLPHKAVFLRNRARLTSANSNHAELAERQLSAAVSLRPSEQDWISDLAELQLFRSPAAASTTAKRATDPGVPNVRALLVLADAQRKQGCVQESTRTITHALRIRGDDSAVSWACASRLLEMDQAEEAWRALQRTHGGRDSFGRRALMLMFANIRHVPPSLHEALLQRLQGVPPGADPHLDAIVSHAIWPARPDLVRERLEVALSSGNSLARELALQTLNTRTGSLAQ